MGGFSTWLYYSFIKIFVECIIIVQIANKVGCKQKKSKQFSRIEEDTLFLRAVYR
jgi:hypothetical protein